MPRRAPSICTYPGCNGLVRGGSRCTQHPYQKRTKSDRAAVRRQDRVRVQQRRANPNDPVHFYVTALWKRKRLSWLRQHPLCVMCEDIGRTTAAGVVDHIVPITAGGARLDDENLQSLCKSCHTAKTNRERAGGSK